MISSSLLFFGQLLTPLLLPQDITINRVSRAVLAFSLFMAAYIAEDVRGGLQAIANEQLEASAALGLSQLQMIRLVVLPQALNTALPSLTNQAIGLLQNTSLMAILGLVELLFQAVILILLVCWFYVSFHFRFTL